MVLVVIGLGPALLAESLIGASAVSTGGSFDLTWLAIETGHAVASAFLCLGYVGLFALIVQVRALRSVMRGLAATGRMALTNYLMQTVLATTVMYWYGLGLFGTTTRWEQMVIVGLFFGFQVCFSLVWLRWFQIGPMEWVWRWATYGRKPLLRRVVMADSEV